MQIKCAWCNEIQGERVPLDDHRVSHTICPKCREVVLGDVKRHDEQADDLWEQAVLITRDHAERIMAEKGDRV